MHRSARLLFDLLVLVLLALQPVNAGIIYVSSSSGSDDNDGLTWLTSKMSIVKALSGTSAGDQVWVAKGEYGTIVIPSGVQLYGGFVGSETGLEGRPSFPRPVFDLNESRIEWPLYMGDYGAAVAFTPGADSTTRIDGFTIHNSSPAVRGGGISCVNCSPTITNNRITGAPFGSYAEYLGTDSRGGGIYCSNASPTIANNTITKSCALHGGGICCDNHSSPTILNNILTGNIGGIDWNWAFIDYPRERPFPGDGGAIYCDGDSSPIIANNVIGANAAGRGGAIYCGAGCSPSIINNTITSNEAEYGGGIYCQDSAPTIANNVVAFNSSGIFSSTPNPTLLNNCVFNPDGSDYQGLSAGSGDLSLDPKLEEVEYGKVHLQPDSPCVNTGGNDQALSDSLDMDGTKRIQGESVDMGADESDGSRWTFKPPIIHVAPWGKWENDGSTWASATQLSWETLDLASSLGAEIWVAEGDNPLYASAPRPYIHIYGGFQGSETRREQRDWREHTSLLSGYYSIQLGVGHRTAVLDGLTVWIQLQCAFSSPTVKNNSLRGISCWHSCPLITENEIAGLGAADSLISCYYSSPTISKNTIRGNSRGKSGGIYCYHSSPLITANAIEGNSPCAIYCGVGSAARILENSISGKTGDAVRYELPCSLVISRNTISSNSVRYWPYQSPHPSQLPVPGSSLTISENTITGGMIDCTGATAVKITGNSIYASKGFGMRIYTCDSPLIAGNTIGGSIRGLALANCTGVGQIVNNTICGSGPGHPGAGISLSSTATTGSVTLANNIIAFNPIGVLNYGSGETVRMNNCLYNPGGTDYSGLAQGFTDILTDPLFVNAAMGDYHLLPDSPCFDAGWDDAPGLPDVDIDGEGRVWHGRVDIGADEIWPRKIKIDVHPGSEVNKINLKSHGLTPVAVLTADGFDASNVLPETVAFAGAPVAQRGGHKLAAEKVDVDGDGDLDLLLHFPTDSLSLDTGSVSATLTGRARDRQWVEGSDRVTVSR